MFFKKLRRKRIEKILENAEKKNLVKKILELDEFKEYKFTKKELTIAAEKAEAEDIKTKLEAEGAKVTLK